MNKKHLDIVKKYSVYYVLIALILFFSVTTTTFLSKANITNFFAQIPSVGIIALALTMILITGCVDLSVASIAAFSGTLAAYLAATGVNPLITIVVAIVAGAIWGWVNAIFITKFKLEPFILTLGTNYVIRGLVLYATNGIYVKGVPDWFYQISNQRFLNGMISSNTIVFIILIFVFSFIMRKTRFGRYCYAVGSNKEAARLSGINTDRHLIKVFSFEGAIAAIAGILIMSTLNVGAPGEGVGLDSLALAGAIMGGAQFGGGVGTISGTVVGILTIQVFQNGLAILGVNTFLQNVVTGLIIVVAIVIDFYRKKNK